MTTRSKPLKTPEVSAMTGVAEATLITWRCIGKGPDYYKVGRSVCYRPEDVESWMEKRKVRVEEPIEA